MAKEGKSSGNKGLKIALIVILVVVLLIVSIASAVFAIFDGIIRKILGFLIDFAKGLLNLFLNFPQAIAKGFYEVMNIVAAATDTAFPSAKLEKSRLGRSDNNYNPKKL